MCPSRRPRVQKINRSSSRGRFNRAMQAPMEYFKHKGEWTPQNRSESRCNRNNVVETYSQNQASKRHKIGQGLGNRPIEYQGSACGSEDGGVMEEESDCNKYNAETRAVCTHTWSMNSGPQQTCSKCNLNENNDRPGTSSFIQFSITKPPTESTEYIPKLLTAKNVYSFCKV